MRTALLALLTFVISACSPNSLIEKGLSLQERSVIRSAIDDISRGDGPALAKKMPPELAPKVPGALPQMQQGMPKSPLEVSVLNVNWTNSGGARTAHAVYQVHGASGWALVDATTQTDAKSTLLTGIYVQQIKGSPFDQNRFTLAAAGPAQLSMIGAMIAVVGITLAGLVRIWRSGLFGRRWLWTIGAFIGVMTLKLNWSTGEYAFQPISFQLFSVSASKQPIYEPWILGVSIPLVAAIALFRGRWKRTLPA